MHPPDAVDVAASLTDPERFAAIFDRHHQPVWTYLARLGGREVADDLAGEVFVRAFACRSTYQADRGAVRAWLYGIATNLWRGRVRSTVRGAVAMRRMEGIARTQPDGADDVAEAMDVERTHRRVVAAMEQLSEADRAILVLAAWEELPYAEIATVLEVPVGTVRSRLARARQRLRELVEPTGEPSGVRDQESF
jgi:RNA polymerase sigma-70 factor (ECF subfamily)